MATWKALHPRSAPTGQPGLSAGESLRFTDRDAQQWLLCVFFFVICFTFR
jgi:hypothetical protein